MNPVRSSKNWTSHIVVFGATATNANLLPGLKLSQSPMLVDPDEFENNNEKQDVAIIGPQQLDEEDPEHPPLANDCMHARVRR